jgi:hypothetical protein
MFLLLHFLLPRKLLEGFAVTLDTVAYALYRFLGHWTIHYFLFWNTCLYFLLIIEDGKCHLETCRTRFTFSLWPPPFLSSSLLFTSTHRPLLYQKNWVINLKNAKIKCFLRFSITKIQLNSKKNRQISIRSSRVGSQNNRKMFKIVYCHI